MDRNKTYVQPGQRSRRHLKEIDLNGDTLIIRSLTIAEAERFSVRTDDPQELQRRGIELLMLACVNPDGTPLFASEADVKRTFWTHEIPRIAKAITQFIQDGDHALKNSSRAKDRTARPSASA